MVSRSCHRISRTWSAHPIQALGKDLVLYRDGSGTWRCFEDICPHQLAPLSEGRVESDGTLLCAYHAWRFNGEGACVRIPQSADAETEAHNCANLKARAIAYPTQEGFYFSIPPTDSGIEQAIHDFQPPCLMRIETGSSDGRHLSLRCVAYPYPTLPHLPNCS